MFLALCACDTSHTANLEEVHLRQNQITSLTISQSSHRLIPSSTTSFPADANACSPCPILDIPGSSELQQPAQEENLSVELKSTPSPQTFGKQSLPGLRLLNLSSNKLSSWPQLCTSFLAFLPSLKQLLLNDNRLPQLSYIPGAFPSLEALSGEILGSLGPSLPSKQL